MINNCELASFKFIKGVIFQMLFKREIKRKPMLRRNTYAPTEFKNCFEIDVSEKSADGIMRAYSDACDFIPSENSAFEALKINLGAGVYEINNTLVFDREPKSGLPIVFTSNGNAVISGGKSFSGGFTYFKNGIYKRKIDAETPFRQLYADGEMCIRCSFPKRSNDYTAEYVRGKWLDSERAIEIPAEIPVEAGENISDLEIFVIEKWTCSVAKIQRAEKRGKNTVFFLNDECAELFFDENRPTKLQNPLCRAENSLLMLTDENEWFFDVKTKTLYYKPKENTDVNKILFTFPSVETLAEIGQNGAIFENITFAFSNWCYPSLHGFAEVQGTRYICKSENGTSWTPPPAAVGVCAENVHFNRCRFLNTGAAALCADCKSSDFKITNCVFSSIGAGAVSAGSFDEKENVPKNVTIANNLIRGVGRAYLGGVGIMAGYTENLLIDANTVEDCGYTGISVGWGWGKENGMGNFTVTNNFVSNIINNYLFDGAGLYLLGRQNGNALNVISGNYLDGGNGYAGLYFDEFSNNYIATDNVILSGKKDGWFLLMHDVGYGIRNVTVENNFISSKKKYINTYRDKSASDRPHYKKSSLKARKVFVKCNYTKKYKGFEELRSMIIENSGYKEP